MKRVQDALKPTGIPAFPGAWKPTASQPTAPAQYLVYTTMTTEDEHWGDDLRRYRVYVYLNLWSDTDPTDTAVRIRSAMYNAGFAMIEESDRGYNMPAYDSATRQYTVQWTWCLREEVHHGDGTPGL